MTVFRIGRDLPWRAPLFIIGATEACSRVTLEDEGLDLRFGIAHLRIPYASIHALCERDWAWWLGIGIRIAPDRTLGLVGSTRGVVQIALKSPSVRGVLFMRHPRNIAVSLENPTGFIDAARSRLHPA